MTCGSHGALEISFRVLCDPGRSILISSPGYTMYNTLASGLDLVVKTYKLLVKSKKKCIFMANNLALSCVA